MSTRMLPERLETCTPAVCPCKRSARLVADARSDSDGVTVDEDDVDVLLSRVSYPVFIVSLSCVAAPDWAG